MEDRVQKLHEIRACLKKFNHANFEEFSDLVNGTIIGIAIADGIVRGEIDVINKSSEENALGIIAAVTLVDSLPNVAIKSIEKMFPDD